MTTDTFDPSTMPTSEKLGAGDRLSVGPRSVLVLRGPTAAELPTHD